MNFFLDLLGGGDGGGGGGSDSVGLSGGGGGSGSSQNLSWDQIQALLSNERSTISAYNGLLASQYNAAINSSSLTPSQKYALALSYEANKDKTYMDKQPIWTLNPDGKSYSVSGYNSFATNPAGYTLLHPGSIDGSAYAAPKSVDSTYTAPAYKGETLGGLFSPSFTPDKYTGTTYNQTEFSGQFDKDAYAKWLATQKDLAAQASTGVESWRTTQDAKANEFYSTAYEKWLQGKQAEYNQSLSQGGLLPQARPLNSDWNVKIDGSGFLSGLIEYLLSDKDGVPKAKQYESPEFKGGLMDSVGAQDGAATKQSSMVLPWQRTVETKKSDYGTDYLKGYVTQPVSTGTTAGLMQGVTPKPAISALKDEKKDDTTGNYLEQYRKSNRRNLDFNWTDVA